MVEDLQNVVSPWRANVKDGEFYTFSMKSPLMHVYVTYNKLTKRLLLSVEKPIYNRHGKMTAIAILHLTDNDLDAVPDSALYAYHFLDMQGRLAGATNIPSEEPTANDMAAWHGWLRIMIDTLQDQAEEVDLYDPDGGA
jgi:hypothetical protein